MTTTTAAPSIPTLQQQAPVLLGHAAGLACSRTIAMGLRHGLIAALAEHPQGRTSDDLAESLSLDPFFTRVWGQGAVAAAICDRDGETYTLAPQMATLLLDRTSPAFVGGVFTLMEQPEMFTRFDTELPTGERLWWDQCSPDWITGVAGTGTPFYTRLIPGGLQQVPDLADRLAAGCRVVDTACGSGVGLLALARSYPNCTVIGIDGDRHSLNDAGAAVAAAGIGDAVTLIESPLEQMTLDRPAAVVLNNISMHECRDIDAVAERVLGMLEPGGIFVISDFPFPETTDGLRSTPGRIMSGIQYFEAQIDDQLLPRTAYDALLQRHGFVGIGHVELTPMHALTYGRRAS
ncbi:class I SAM-dependent methyltransferase [Nakamurella lactea]|uniref:class I SAM-dependent methyltransferase n=1 Tax=Nakamurella lactea TaxID=459515 RepID=UPI00040EF9DC|nr:class I SAM-dependent methyltransferase [Nakamurella lactea]